jgi:hypothetical protein
MGIFLGGHCRWKNDQPGIRGYQHLSDIRYVLQVAAQG